MLVGDRATFDISAKRNPSYTASAVVWALMGKALEKWKGFQEGTFRGFRGDGAPDGQYGAEDSQMLSCWLCV